ncbi:MAG: ribonuclease T2 family protein [Methylococcaceae bacterium]|jgi:ribonuclease T2
MAGQRLLIAGGLAVIALLPGLNPAGAFEPVRGEFLAQTTCLATVAIARPDAEPITVTPGAHYPVLGLNQRGGDHIQIRVALARPSLRWVSLTCGELLGDMAAKGATPASDNRPPRKLLLALSWQASFCESRPEKVECRTQSATRFDANHFSLHGLWPQPPGVEYCGVSPAVRASDQRQHWDELPEPALSPDTRNRLMRAMPGVVSDLQRHEWARHGSCYGSDAETYFRTALALLEQINHSGVGDFMARQQGTRVAVAQIRTAFDRSFGAGANQALTVCCSTDGERQLISELRVALKQPLSETTPLSDALDRSLIPRGNCDAGIVERVGMH